MDYTQAMEKLEQCGQTHLLRWYDALTETEQEALLEQVDALDPGLLSVFAAHSEEAQRGKLEPLGALTLQDIAESRERFEAAGL